MTNKFSNAQSRIQSRVKTAITISAVAIASFIGGNKMADGNEETKIYDFEYNVESGKIYAVATSLGFAQGKKIYDLQKQFLYKNLYDAAIGMGKDLAPRLSKETKAKLMQIPFAASYGTHLDAGRVIVDREPVNLFRYLTHDDFKSGIFLYYIYCASSLYTGAEFLAGGQFEFENSKDFGIAMGYLENGQIKRKDKYRSLIVKEDYFMPIRDALITLAEIYRGWMTRETFQELRMAYTDYQDMVYDRQKKEKTINDKDMQTWKKTLDKNYEMARHGKGRD